MFIGIEIGISEARALLLTDDHIVLGTASAELSVSHPHPGFSEQNLHDWWLATQFVPAQLRQTHPAPHAVTQAIGLCGQMPGAVLLAERAASPLLPPHLSGERTPHNDAKVHGSFHQLGFDTDAACLGCAAMEGVSFGLKDELAALNAVGSAVAPCRWLAAVRAARSGPSSSPARSIPVLLNMAAQPWVALWALRGWLGWMAASAFIGAVCRTPAAKASCLPDAAEQEMLVPHHAEFRQMCRAS